MKKNILFSLCIISSLIILTPIYAKDEAISKTKYFQKLNTTDNSTLVNLGMNINLLVGYEKIETSDSTEDGLYYNIQPGFFIDAKKNNWYFSNKINFAFYHNTRLNDIKLFSFDDTFFLAADVKKIFSPGLGLRLSMKERITKEKSSAGFQDYESSITPLKQLNSYFYFNFQIIENLYLKNTIEYQMTRYNDKNAIDDIGLPMDKKDTKDDLSVSTVLFYQIKINDFTIEPKNSFKYSFVVDRGKYNTCLKWGLSGGIKLSYLDTDLSYFYKYTHYNYYLREDLTTTEKENYYQYHILSLSNSSLYDVTFSAAFSYIIVDSDLDNITEIYDFTFSISIPIDFHKGFETPLLVEKDSGGDAGLYTGGGDCVGGSCSI